MFDDSEIPEELPEETETELEEGSEPAGEAYDIQSITEMAQESNEQLAAEEEAQSTEETQEGEAFALPKSAQEEQLGYNSMVFIEALFKRFIDAISGRGGVEAVTIYADQLDFVDNLPKLRERMKNNDMFFQTALSKCNKELLKRSIGLREGDMYDLLGYACDNCGKKLMRRKSICACGGHGKSLFREAYDKIRNLGFRKITPEAILMEIGYTRLADAYCDAFLTFRSVMEKTAKLFGWVNFKIENPELINYLESYFLGRLPGESKIPREEKEVLQFLIRGNLIKIDLPVAYKLIRDGIDIVKYGYMFEVLGCTGADVKYEELVIEFGKEYDEVNKKIRTELYKEVEANRGTVTNVRKVTEGLYAPMMLMPSQYWENGTISSQIMLEPMFKLPIHPKADMGSLQMLYAPIGSGKTFCISSMISYAIEVKHELIFNVLGDKSNSFCLAFMELFGYDPRTIALRKMLERDLGVVPHGIPVLNLSFMKKGYRVPGENSINPPTIYDRIIEYNEPRGFKVDYPVILEEFKKIVRDFKWKDKDGNDMSYNKNVGMINVRNFDRINNVTNETVDIQITINLLTQFDAWRKTTLGQPMRVLIDELSYLAPAQVHDADSSRSGATISDFIKESRRDRCSFDAATQRPLEIITDIRDSSTNILFRELPASKAKDKSQIDFILESVQLKDPSVRTVIRDINNRGLLSAGKYWFWYCRENRSINIVRPCPPLFCLQDSRRTPAQLIKLYEKKTGQKVLLKSWDEVPIISVAESDKKKATKSKFF